MLLENETNLLVAIDADLSKHIEAFLSKPDIETLNFATLMMLRAYVEFQLRISFCSTEILDISAFNPIVDSELRQVTMRVNAYTIEKNTVSKMMDYIALNGEETPSEINVIVCVGIPDEINIDLGEYVFVY